MITIKRFTSATRIKEVTSVVRLLLRSTALALHAEQDGVAYSNPEHAADARRWADVGHSGLGADSRHLKPLSLSGRAAAGATR
jgi:hypothetical protein